MSYQQTPACCSIIPKTLPRISTFRKKIVNDTSGLSGIIPIFDSQSGIQYIKPGSETGYLYLFRELLNMENSKAIRLEKMAGKTIEFKELLTGKSWVGSADKDGIVKFTIPEPATFMFIQYKEI